ncbi:hypothetical protein ABRY23_06760 [Melioribacteraceae bacterium 4301-Me]|uniref:hypothetical protein n=1 Tax=Pyranulibacter aquaticus TaxID=3163344 RepID=UPI00359824AB
MAKVKQRQKEIRNKKKKLSPFNDYWTKANYLILSIGFLLLLLGYFLMAQGPWDSFLSVSVSPIILLIAYIVIIPIAILYRKKNKENKQSNVPSQN